MLRRVTIWFAAMLVLMGQQKTAAMILILMQFKMFSTINIYAYMYVCMYWNIGEETIGSFTQKFYCFGRAYLIV